MRIRRPAHPHPTAPAGEVSRGSGRTGLIAWFVGQRRRRGTDRPDPLALLQPASDVASGLGAACVDRGGAQARPAARSADLSPMPPNSAPMLPVPAAMSVNAPAMTDDLGAMMVNPATGSVDPCAMSPNPAAMFPDPLAVTANPASKSIDPGAMTSNPAEGMDDFPRVTTNTAQRSGVPGDGSIVGEEQAGVPGFGSRARSRAFRVKGWFVALAVAVLDAGGRSASWVRSVVRPSKAEREARRKEFDAHFTIVTIPGHLVEVGLVDFESYAPRALWIAGLVSVGSYRPFPVLPRHLLAFLFVFTRRLLGLIASVARHAVPGSLPLPGRAVGCACIARPPPRWSIFWSVR